MDTRGATQDFARDREEAMAQAAAAAPYTFTVRLTLDPRVTGRGEEVFQDALADADLEHVLYDAVTEAMDSSLPTSEMDWYTLDVFEGAP